MACRVKVSSVFSVCTEAPSIHSHHPHRCLGCASTPSHEPPSYRTTVDTNTPCSEACISHEGFVMHLVREYFLA